MKDSETNKLEQLQEKALQLGLPIDGDAATLESAIHVALGEFGYVPQADAYGVSEEDRKAHAKDTLAAIMSGEIEVAGNVDFATKYPERGLPNLMPMQIPWGGRRMRMKRIRQTEDDLVPLVLQWNGSRFLFPLECEFADVPWPHYLIMKNAEGSRLKQDRVLQTDGRIIYVDNWVKTLSYPYQVLGVTPGTENLPRGMKEYIYEMYIEGFPNFTPGMWRQLSNAYDFSDKALGIQASLPIEQQLSARRVSLFDRLGLMDMGDAREARGDKKGRNDRIAYVKEVIANTPLADEPGLVAAA